MAQTYGDTEPGGGALLGSVKSNLGHALAASGALGLAKILVAAEHAAIPRTLHAAEASPEIDWEKQGLRLATDPDAVARGRWATGRGHLGIRYRRHQRARHRLTSRGGVMLAQPLPDGRVPILLSAHDEKLIAQDARAILDYLDRVDAGPRSDGRRRVHPPAACDGCGGTVRWCGPADRDELVAGLSALARDEEHPLVARSSKSVAPSVAFVFPGQGNQWQSMGAEAYRRLPAYRAEADRCAEAFVAAGLPSPLPYLLGDEDQQWSRTQIQGAQFVHAVSLASQWRSSGVLPGITIGHSLGEIAAAYVAEKVSYPTRSRWWVRAPRSSTG